MIIEHGTESRLCKCYPICIFSTKEDACSFLNSAACSCDVGNFAMARRINTVDVQLNDPASDLCHIVPVEKEELYMPYEYTDTKYMLVRSESMHRDHVILIPNLHMKEIDGNFVAQWRL